MKRRLYLGLSPPPPEDNVELLFYPVIRIVPIVDDVSPPPFYTHLIFTSKTAVHLFSEKRPLPTEKTYIAVGKKTAEALHQKGIGNVLIAEKETAEGVVELLKTLKPKEPPHFFWPHSKEARRVIPEMLLSYGWPLTEAILYEIAYQAPTPKPDLSTIDEIFFTSPTTVEGFLLAYGALPLDKPLLSIGPITAAHIQRELSLHNCSELLSSLP